MKETASVPPPGTNGVDLSGRFVPDADPNAAVPSFAEKVAHRAYYLYMDSAATHGHDLEHWLLGRTASPGAGNCSKKGFLVESSNTEVKPVFFPLSTVSRTNRQYHTTLHAMRVFWEE